MAKHKLRIGFTLPNVRDLTEAKGAALQLAHIIHGLQDRGHQVSILKPLPGRRILFADDLQVEGYGRLSLTNSPLFKIVESAIRRLQRVLKIPYLGLFESGRFYDACIQNLSEYDILHERNELFSIGAALASRRLGKPYVLSLDADELFELAYVGKPLRGIRQAFAAWMARFNYRTAAAFTCVSPAAKRHFVAEWDIPEEKITVLSNGVDIQFFQSGQDHAAIRAELGLEEAVIILFIGGFYPWHGLDMLVDSFHLISPKTPQAKLILVGDGETRPAIEKKVAAYGLEKAVIFTGPVPHETIPAYLRAADICVAPYPRFETEFWGSPLKLFEYMAAGKAIVASGAGQIAAVIQNGQTGLVVEPGDSQEFAAALAALLNDPVERKRLGQNAFQQAVAHHSWENYVNQLEAIYARVL